MTCQKCLSTTQVKRYSGIPICSECIQDIVIEWYETNYLNKSTGENEEDYSAKGNENELT